MKKQILKVVFTMALFFVGVTACQKDAYIQNSTSKRVKDEKKYKTYSPEKINEVRLAFAKTLSSAIREEALRKYIHTLMQKRFINHDYEMVYITEKNKIVYDGKTFAQILTSFADSETLNKFGNVKIK